MWLSWDSTGIAISVHNIASRDHEEVLIPLRAAAYRFGRRSRGAVLHSANALFKWDPHKRVAPLAKLFRSDTPPCFPVT